MVFSIGKISLFLAVFPICIKNCSQFEFCFQKYIKIAKKLQILLDYANFWPKMVIFRVWDSILCVLNFQILEHIKGSGLCLRDDDKRQVFLCQIGDLSEMQP